MPLLNHDLKPGDKYFVIIDGKIEERILDEKTTLHDRLTSEYESPKEAEEAFNAKQVVYFLEQPDSFAGSMVMTSLEMVKDHLEADLASADSGHVTELKITLGEMTIHEIYELPEYDG
jgi:hypothetical protein